MHFARTVICMTLDGSFPQMDRRERLSLWWARRLVLTKHAWDTLLWGSVVSSSTRSSSTTTSTARPPFSQMLAYVALRTTQRPVRTRYIAVGPVSFRSYKTAESLRLWLWVTRPHDRSWELKMVSRSSASDRPAKYRSLYFKSYRRSIPHPASDRTPTPPPPHS